MDQLSLLFQDILSFTLGGLLSGLIIQVSRRGQRVVLEKLTPQQKSLVQKIFKALDPVLPDVPPDHYDRAVRIVAEHFAPDLPHNSVDLAIAGYYQLFSPAERRTEETTESKEIQSLLASEGVMAMDSVV